MPRKEKKTLSLRLDDSLQEWLERNWYTRAEGAEAAITGFYSLYRASLTELAGKLTKGELSIILDVMNGTILESIMIGCHVGLSVHDGIALNGYDQKWGVDREFPSRLAAMPRAHLAALEIWSAQMWRHCDDDAYWEEQISRMAKPE